MVLMVNLRSRLALDNGFSGSLQDWLQSLVGAKGADGINGKDGKDGVNGTTVLTEKMELTV